LLIAANIPDIDVAMAAGGSVSYLHYHRHLTHALVMMPVMALLAVAIVRFIGRVRVQWVGAFCAALIGVASHLLLDWTNIYGIRLLLPFSGRWLSADTTPVVDPWIWALIGLGIAGPFLARLVGSEIASGPVKERHHGRGFAWFALFAILFYNYGRGALHGRAVAELSARLYDGETPLRVTAVPNTANPLVWRGIVETSGAYWLPEVNLASGEGVPRGAVFRKEEWQPAMQTARETGVFQTYLDFSQYPLWRVTPDPALENGRLVEIFDLRFGTPLEPAFTVQAVIDANGRAVSSNFRFGAAKPR
jgi:inner membrane protein